MQKQVSAIKVTFTLEQGDDGICVFADERCPGYYLWATDKERLLASVVPLAQHIFWENGHEILIPQEEPDLSVLLSGRLEICFLPGTRLAPPAIAVEGFWMESPNGRSFFIPQHKRQTCQQIVKRIEADLSNGL